MMIINFKSTYTAMVLASLIHDSKVLFFTQTITPFIDDSDPQSISRNNFIKLVQYIMQVIN